MMGNKGLQYRPDLFTPKHRTVRQYLNVLHTKRAAIGDIGVNAFAVSAHRNRMNLDMRYALIDAYRKKIQEVQSALDDLLKERE